MYSPFSREGSFRRHSRHRAKANFKVQRLSQGSGTICPPTADGEGKAFFKAKPRGFKVPFAGKACLIAFLLFRKQRDFRRGKPSQSCDVRRFPSPITSPFLGHALIGASFHFLAHKRKERSLRWFIFTFFTS